MSSEQISLEPNCSDCAALCCVVFAFDRSESFGADKAAGEPCAHLDPANRCKIFAERIERGYRGCISYDCRGAGQRVTQEIFAGRSWRDEPGLTHRMGAALSVMRRIHELLLLLNTANQLPLNVSEHRQLEQFNARLSPGGRFDESSLAVFPIERLEKEIAAWLPQLRHHLG